MTKIENVLLTGKTHTTVSGKDGRLDIKLSSPGKEATPDHLFTAIQPHPTAEQLFAGAWSACFIAAIGLVAQEKKVQLPSDLSVEIEVDLGKTGDAYLIQARFNVRVPGVPRDVAEAIVHAAHEICPYSKATRGNIDVTLNVIAA
ncbi:MAG TPA: Ohr family peroxiredoxin [Aliidongia sp.]|nr:Ohr family peroxiredoxin [Aliidongia sp.]